MSRLDAWLGEPWLITPDALANLITIANREVGENVPVLVEPARMTMAGGVATIPIRGPILRFANLLTTHCGATALSRVSSEFEAAIGDSAVRSIVLDIDSPGGQAAGVQSFADQVFAARAIKPITARVESLAASAAYWIGAAASRLEISETASVGSVGVVLTAQRSARGEIEVVSSQSPKKRQDPASAEGRADLQRLVDQLADVFVDRVAQFRGVTRAHVLEHFGQGWIKTGNDAVSARMADAIGGGLSRTTAAAAPALTAEQRWDADPSLRAEFGFSRDRWLAYERRPR